MTNRPCIGVTSSRHGGRIMWWLNAFSVFLAGGAGHRITADDDPSVFDVIDGLIVGGGDDIGADLYKGRLEMSVRMDPARDALELAGIERAIARHVPILGICRGAQLINIHFDGTLHQEVTDAFPGIDHRRTVLPRKRVDILPRSHLGRLLRATHISVNSLHHQAIDRLGTGLQIAARDRNNMVQAIEKPGYPLLIGVQWHPEFLFYRGHHLTLFRALLNQARRIAARKAATA